ncbi:hypothetical protein GPX89_26505 [Nocardia sp. ET3-3]|uniref:Prokaryotic cytochrome C oxidase subunit IV family protein n=1 Tax=Nocardia terrae TaxID=2675851 RepID=A0A7K1V2R4_9NOCA|nr:cytochrome C oxidase subunit IV family protein [Nocardia terrae]MVU80792.1 hypothetical protein [Nocardia terrae]
MIALARTRATMVWLILIAATSISWALGVEHALGRDGQTTASVIILLVAVVKLRLVGLYFMELRDAPTILRGLFEAYCVVVGAVTLGMYFLA